jgi:hypothetical protein
MRWKAEGERQKAEDIFSNRFHFRGLLRRVASRNDPAPQYVLIPILEGILRSGAM